MTLHFQSEFVPYQVSSGKPAAFPGSVLPSLLNMSFPERLSLYLMLVNLFVYGIQQM